MRYRVRHHTEYHYGTPVANGHNIAHLTPRETPRQRVLQHQIQVLPEPALQAWRDDIFGNRALYFGLHEPHRQLSVTAVSELEVQDPEPVRETCGVAWERWRDGLGQRREPAAVEACQYLTESPLVSPGAELRALALESFTPGRGLLEAVQDLTRRIHQGFTYAPGSTGVTTPLAQVLRQRRGVCQDFAQVAIGALRSVGLPARYVSGYLETRPPPGQPRLVGADASHAWFAVYHPELGWLDLDPTNDLRPASAHVVTAWGRDYSDVPPVKGVIYGGGARSARVSVDVEPLAAEARP